MSIRAFAAAAAALALAAPVGAQPRPRPDDPAVKTPPSAQTSAFEGYRRFRDEDMVPWREVNDEVGRLGGHMGHVKDEAAPAAMESTGQTPSQPAPQAVPQPAPRAGAAEGQKHAR